MVLDDSNGVDSPIHLPDYDKPATADFAFWDDYCKRYIDPLLDAGHYSEAERTSHRDFIRSKKEALARFGFATNGPQSFTAEDPLGVKTSYEALVRFAQDEDSGVDLRWLHCLMALYPRPDSIKVAAESSLYKNYSRRVALAAGVDIDGPRRNLMVHLSPFIKHAMTGMSESESVFDAIKNLKPGGPALRPAVKLLEGYLSTGAGDFYLGNQFIGIDCADSSKAQVKPYMATDTARFDHIRTAMTLSGRLDDEYTRKGMQILGDIWHLLLDEPDGIRPDWNKPRNKLHVDNALPGVFVSYEIRAEVELPDVKVYKPMWLYHRSDEAVAEIPDRVFARIRDRDVMEEWAWGGDIGEDYSQFFKKTFDAGGVPRPTMVHTWCTYCFTKDRGVYMISYTAKNVDFPLPF